MVANVDYFVTDEHIFKASIWHAKIVFKFCEIEHDAVPTALNWSIACFMSDTVDGSKDFPVRLTVGWLYTPPPKKKQTKKNKKQTKKKKKKCPILVKAKLSYWNGLICLIFCQHFKSNYFFLFLLQHSLSDVVLSWKHPRWFLLILRCWYRMHLIPNHNVIDVEVLTSGSVYVLSAQR